MLLRCHFNSWALERSESVTVILPTDIGSHKNKSHNRGSKLPVLYLLHGGGSDHTHWQRYTQIERYANENMIAVVMPHSQDRCYRNAELRFENLPNEVEFERNEDFFLKELPEWVSSNFPISSAPENSYIAGFSLGGYGTAYFGFSHPENYRAIGLLSGYVYDPALFDPKVRYSLTNEEIEKRFFPELLSAIDENLCAGKKFPTVFLSHGEREVTEPDGILAALLRRKGISAVEDENKYDFGHQWQTWDPAIEAFLKMIPRSDDFAVRK